MVNVFNKCTDTEDLAWTASNEIEVFVCRLDASRNNLGFYLKNDSMSKTEVIARVYVDYSNLMEQLHELVEQMDNRLREIEEEG